MKLKFYLFYWGKNKFIGYDDINLNQIITLLIIFDRIKNKTMLTLNTIIKEMKDVPIDRLEELYEFVHSLTPKTKQTETIRKKILSFGGAFNDMTNKDYTEYFNHTKKSRSKLFDRNVDL